LEVQLAYWRQRLGISPPVLELPIDRARPAGQSFRGARRRVHRGPRIGEGLAALARREGATLFMVLLAGFQALLGRLSGQAEVLVGSPVAGRNRGETEG